MMVVSCWSVWVVVSVQPSGSCSRVSALVWFSCLRVLVICVSNVWIVLLVA